MSLHLKSDDLFGGLSDSDDDARDEKLPTSSKQSIDLLQEMAMSGSSNDESNGNNSDDGDDGDDEGEEKGELANRPKLMTKNAPSKIISKSNSNSPSHPIESSKTRAFKCSNENSNQPLSNNRKKRKFKEVGKSDFLPDGLDALTSQIDSQPKIAKLLKRNSDKSNYALDKLKNSASVVTEKSMFSCPSSSTVVENDTVLANYSAPQKEPTNHHFSAAQNAQELRQLEHLLILGNLSKSQLERYEVYRRSTFNKAAMKRIIERATGAPASEALVLAIRSLAKQLVGDLVEEAVELRETRNETNKPLQPHHIKTVFKDLVGQGKLWPPYNFQQS